MGKRVIISALLVFIAVGIVNAYHPDAPYLAHAKRHKAEWAKQDRQINERLAALEKRFGKKPKGLNKEK